MATLACDRMRSYDQNMTRAEFAALAPGDLIRLVGLGEHDPNSSFIVRRVRKDGVVVLANSVTGRRGTAVTASSWERVP